MLDYVISKGVGIMRIRPKCGLSRNITIHQQHDCVPFSVFCLQTIQLLVLRISSRAAPNRSKNSLSQVLTLIPKRNTSIKH